MSNIDNIKDIMEFIQQSWLKTIGLFASIVVSIFVELAIFAKIDIHNSIEIIILLSTIVVILFFWSKSYRITKTKKNKIGFVVSFHCDDEKERKRFEEDFINTIRKLIKQGKTGKSFQLIILPERIAKKINNYDIANKIRNKLKAHFILYGRIRLRNFLNNLNHIIEMNGIVGHTPVKEDIRSQLSQEFNELLPRRVNFKEGNDLLGFDFTSDWTNIVVKYIIGIAATISNDFDYAINLYDDVLSHLNKKQTNFPVFVKLQRRVPLRLAEIYMVKAGSSYNKWLENQDFKYIEEIGTSIEKIDPLHRNLYGYLTIKSIYIFLEKRDFQTAINLLKKCKKIEDPTWHLSLAFLYAYSGDLRLSIREYKKVELYPIKQPYCIFQVETFINYILENEPEKYQINYALGYFYWKIKGDNLLAKEHLIKFLAEKEKNKYEFEENKANEWIIQINKEN
jgi:hypothetical protein